MIWRMLQSRRPPTVAMASWHRGMLNPNNGRRRTRRLEVSTTKFLVAVFGPEILPKQLRRLSRRQELPAPRKISKLWPRRTIVLWTTWALKQRPWNPWTTSFGLQRAATRRARRRVEAGAVAQGRAAKQARMPAPRARAAARVRRRRPRVRREGDAATVRGKGALCAWRRRLAAWAEVVVSTGAAVRVGPRDRHPRRNLARCVALRRR
mmetsp:Transcript_26843/g.39717  ORF Transcript_26843/g.39717 Transcript_26843/m.39717 type:complete len:208 (-) Transcript_26843:8-631(-)